jgi:hypothetical protein
MIAQCVMMIDLKISPHKIANIIFPHPTVSEAISEAIHGITGRLSVIAFNQLPV